MFENEMGQSDGEFSGLPQPVAALLANDLGKQPWTADERAAANKALREPTGMGIDWTHLSGRDPVAALQELILGPMARALGPDLVIVLPDISFFPLLEGSHDKSATVGSFLGRYSACDTWSVVNGAAVGSLTSCECGYPAQANRSALAKFVTAVNKAGVIGISALGDYMADQRPTASDSWTDIMMLAMANLVIFQDYVGDYPFNVRLYLALDKSDWALIHTGRPFPASALSGPAQENLLNVLVQSRSVIEKEHGDPALWHTLDFTRLTVTAELESKAVLIGFTGPGGEVRDAADSGLQYAMRKKSLGREPLYQPGTQKKLKLTVASPFPGESIETGFAEVTPGDTKPVVWNQLPPDLAAQFKKNIDFVAQSKGGVRNPDNPPPP